MATDTRPTATERGWKPYLLTVDQFLAMIAANIFPDNANVELLGGILVETMTKGTPHDYTLGAACEELRRMIPGGWLLREDKSLQLGPRSRPEPDIAIVRGPRAQYSRRTPNATETTLVVEVTESSYAYDRGEKWRRYAAARIPIYWIINLARSQVEVYRDPAGRGRSAAYRQAETFGIDATVPVVIDGREVGRVTVRDIMP